MERGDGGEGVIALHGYAAQRLGRMFDGGWHRLLRIDSVEILKISRATASRMIKRTMLTNEITYKIRGAIFKVYSALGPGLYESVYQTALAYQLQVEGLEVRTEVPISIHYEDIEIPMAFRIDILVNNRVIVELKSVAELERIHYKQLRTYLRLSHLKTGILVNFNTDDILRSTHTIVDEKSWN